MPRTPHREPPVASTPLPPGPEARKRYDELAAKVDAFFDRVASRHAGEMACRSGCTDCCQAQLTLTAVEAGVLSDRLPTLPPAIRRRLAGRARVAMARTDDSGPCAGLGAGGRCELYANRPLVCRSHGVPVRVGRAALPVLEACPHNFRDDAVARLAPEDVLDQETLSTVLHAVNALHARESGASIETRVRLAELLSRLA